MRFKACCMRSAKALSYIATRLATDWPDQPQRVPAWVRLVKRVLPAANPDFDALIPQVRHWWLEVDEAGVPQREIGFDSTGGVLFVAPVGDNGGFWTDSEKRFLVSDNELVTAEAFENIWREFMVRWNAPR